MLIDPPAGSGGSQMSCCWRMVGLVERAALRPDPPAAFASAISNRASSASATQAPPETQAAPQYGGPPLLPAVRRAPREGAGAAFVHFSRVYEWRIMISPR